MFEKFKKLFKPIDLTTGNVFKKLILFLIPIMLSSACLQLFNLTDSVVAGHFLSPEEIAGINDVGALSNFSLMFAIGCSSGFAVVISHRFGKKDEEGIKKSFATNVMLMLIITAILTIVSSLLVDQILSLLKITASGADATKDLIYKSAKTYLLITFLGVGAIMFFNMIYAVLNALGESFVPFLFLVVGVAANVVLDLLFMAVFKWGVLGAAIATVLTRLVSATLCLIYGLRKFKYLRFKFADFKTSWKDLYAHLKLGLPLGFQFSILEIGIVIMQMAVIKFDYYPNGMAVPSSPAQVGYGVACQLGAILMLTYSSLGTGMMTYFGQNYGAKKYDRIKKGFTTSLLLGSIAWVLITAFGMCLTINNAFLHIFLSSSNITEDVAYYANTYIWFTVPFQYFLMILFLSRGSLQGLNNSLFPFLAGVLELFTRSLICLFLPQYINGGPINCDASTASYISVCFADVAAWVGAGLFMLVPFIIKVFKKKKVNQIEEQKDSSDQSTIS